MALPCDVLMSIICPSGRGCSVEYIPGTATSVGTRRCLRADISMVTVLILT